jgi:hypothetical protein
MPTLVSRIILAGSLLLCFRDIVLAEPKTTPAVAEDQRLLPYVKPDQMIDIGGRRIHLRCGGSGGPRLF